MTRTLPLASLVRNTRLCSVHFQGIKVSFRGNFQIDLKTHPENLHWHAHPHLASATATVQASLRASRRTKICKPTLQRIFPSRGVFFH